MWMIDLLFCSIVNSSYGEPYKSHQTYLEDRLSGPSTTFGKKAVVKGQHWYTRGF